MQYEIVLSLVNVGLSTILNVNRVEIVIIIL